MKAIALIVALGLLAATVPAEAEKAGQVPRIGFLPSRACGPVMLGAFHAGLGELGYVPAQNIAIECRSPEGKPERLPDLAAELVQLNVDVILAVGSQATRAVINATRTIPIVFTFVGGPVELGFVASFARPGGNATGLTSVPGFEIIGKQLKLLKDVVPDASRVAILSNPTNPFTPGALREMEVAARSLGVELQILEARGPDEFDNAFAAMTIERAGALLVVPDALFLVHRKRIADLAANSRLPTMFSHTPNVKAGGLMAYATSLPDLWRRAATYVDKILRGANPADLPVERPTKFELVINLKTAKALDLTIPDSLLFQADRVIR